MTNVEIASPSLALRRLPNGLALFSVALFAIATRFFDEGAGRNAALVAAAVSFVAAAGLRAVARIKDARPGAKGYLTAAGLGDVLILVGAVIAHLAEKGSVELALGMALLIHGVALVVSLELVAMEMRAAGFIDMRRVLTAARTAATVVFAVVALVLINYGFNKLDLRRDFAFAAPTAPSAATTSLLESVQCGDAASPSGQKPEVFLFFERGNTAYHEVKDYFDVLARHGARTTLQDQAADPVLAKDLKVSKNGVIAFRCGARTETHTVGETREDAAKKVKKLDEEVRTKLARISRDPQQVYVTVGHGERSLDDAPKPGERANARGLKRLVESTNAKLKKLGIAEGLTKEVPTDAALVIIAGPTAAFLPEEITALKNYIQRGGSLMLLFDPIVPGSPDVQASFDPLLASLGVRVGTHEVLNDKEYAQKSNTDADWAFVFSTSFGTHKSVKSLSNARGKAALLFMSAASVDKRPDAATGEGAAKVSLVARTRPASFIDANDSRKFDEGSEARAILDLAAAVEVPGAKEGRAIVVGDSDAVADGILAQPANTVFAYEALLWLLRDDDRSADGVKVEDDVEIMHTRDEDKAWFYGTVVVAPLAVVIGGLMFLSRKRSRRGGGA